MEPPLRQRERHRLEVIRRYPALDELPAHSFGQVVQLARRVFGVTAAAVHIPAGNRLFFASSVEVASDALAALCDRFTFGNSGARVLIQEDLVKHPEYAQDPLVAGKPGFRFFAGVPLRAPDGVLVGTLCLLDAAARSFSNTEVELLLSIGDSAMQELELRRTDAESARLLQEHPHPHWIYDVETATPVYANEAALQFYGHAASDFLSLRVEQLLDSADAEALADLAIRDAGTKRLASAGHVTREGDVRRAETVVSTTYREGRAARMVEVHTSLEAQQQEEEQRQAESFYRRVLDELPAQVSVLDTEGRILFLNEQSGQEQDLRTWLIGKTWADYYSRRNVGPEVAERRQRLIESATQERRQIEFEEVIPNAEGHPHRHVTRVKPVLRSDGSVRYLTCFSIDVTDGRPHADDVQVGEQRLRAFIRNIPRGIALFDVSGRLLEVNPALLKATGYSPEELTQQEHVLSRLAHPEESARVRQLFEGVATGRVEHEHFETRLVRKDGSVIWGQVSLAHVRDPRPGSSPILAILEDVTTRRNAEQELKKTARRYSMLIDQAPDAVFVARYRGPLIDVNARACELSGYSREDLLRLRPEELIRNGDQEARDECWDLLTNGKTLELERRIMRRDRRMLPVELSMRLIDDRLVMIIVRDAAERNERTRHLEFQANALSQISEAVVATDILGGLTYMNSSAEELLGIKAEEAVGRHTSEVVRAHLVGTQQLGEIAEILFREGQWRGEVAIDLPENQRVYTEVSVLLARDRNGFPIGTLAVARDVTERKEYEHNLIVAKEEAEEMNRLKTAFLANMSHEIRTPLTSIIGFAEVLSEEAAESEREFASLIRNSGRRLMETLNSVLDLAQLESDALKLDPVQINIMEPIQEALDLFRSKAEDKGLYLEAEADHPGPVLAHLDRVGLSRVLINLVSNAVKFTHQGGVRVYVRSDENHVHITVKDTGVGIGRDFLPHLFDEFKQESSGLSRNYEGSGLGLTITKRLVELMDGAIDVESEKNRGTVFVLTFPR